jgi:hypothetical protein
MRPMQSGHGDDGAHPLWAAPTRGSLGTMEIFANWWQEAVLATPTAARKGTSSVIMLTALEARGAMWSSLTARGQKVSHMTTTCNIILCT